MQCTSTLTLGRRSTSSTIGLPVLRARSTADVLDPEVGEAPALR